ncbi:MAG: CinA family protein [Eubacterium sp.]|nr:CinA family protein [Eubacterium sp.]
MVEGKTDEKNDLLKESVVRSHYRDLTLLLIEKGITITTMESATSGQIASLITDTEGASSVFRGAYITYCNEVKVAHGVPQEVIDTYTVYSTQTAEAMAKASAERFQADIGIGVTGTTGNVDPANPEASVPGQVFFAIVFRGRVYSFQRQMGNLATRLEYKMAVADEVYLELMKLLEEDPQS